MAFRILSILFFVSVLLAQTKTYPGGSETLPSYMFDKGTKPCLHFNKGRTDSSVSVTWSTSRYHDVNYSKINNYDFETDITGWTGINATIQQDASEFVTGTKSLKFTGSGDSAWVYTKAYPDPLSKNTYDIRFQIKVTTDYSVKVAVSLTTDWTDRIYHIPYTDDSTFYRDEGLTSSMGWVTLDMEFISDNQAGGIYDSVYILIGNNSGMTGKVFYIDSIRCYESHYTPIRGNTVLKYWEDGVPETVYTDSTDESVTFHRADIYGLTPDTKYWYNVRTDTSGSVYYQSDTYYFYTAPPVHQFTRNFTFASFSDFRGTAYHDYCRDRWYNSGNGITLDTYEFSNGYFKQNFDSLAKNHWDDIDFLTGPGETTTHNCPTRYWKQFNIMDTVTAYKTWTPQIGDHEPYYIGCYLHPNADSSDRFGICEAFEPTISDSNMSAQGYGNGHIYDSLSFYFDYQNCRIIHRYWEYEEQPSNRAEFWNWFENAALNLPDGIEWVFFFTQETFLNSGNANPSGDDYANLYRLRDKITAVFQGDVHQFEVFDYDGIPIWSTANGGNSASDISQFSWNDGNIYWYRGIGYTLITVKEDRVLITEYISNDLNGQGNEGKLYEIVLRNKFGNSGTTVSNNVSVTINK